MPRSDAYTARNQAIKANLGDINAARQVLLPTQEVIASEANRLQVVVRIQDIPDSDGARLHWIGNVSNQTVILYVHGGGYGFPAMPGHVSFWIETQARLMREGKSFAVALLEYTLTPDKVFPAQIQQSVMALDLLLKSQRKPQDIIIAGDSAGGNLVLGMISAALHQHDGVPSIQLNDNLRGAILISPWVSYDNTAASHAENAERDVIPIANLTAMAATYRSSPMDDKDPFFAPLVADSEWWTGAPVNAILNIAGEEEIFRDDIVEIGNRIQMNAIEIETVICKGQVHIDAILDSMSGLDHGPMSFAIWDWLSKRL